MTVEKCGTQFDLSHFLAARANTIQAVKLTAQKILPGMNEAQAVTILKQELENLGIEKFWHPTKFRLNHNTTKNFRDISEEVILLENDIFFIDIGPVFFNHEGDYGETFIIGSDPLLKNLKEASINIFKATQDEWKKNKLSGIELYEFAHHQALKYNLRLNSNMYGHRLGDFPHALHYKGKLGTLDNFPSPHLWVLEIHLIDDSIGRGAFYEDILI